MARLFGNSSCACPKPCYGFYIIRRIYLIQSLIGEFKMEPTKSERESFWNAKTYALVADHTKPAIKWAISELKNRGKNVYVIDLSDKPEPGSLRKESELPAGLDRAVLGSQKPTLEILSLP
jgi:hypothetical protein